MAEPTGRAGGLADALPGDALKDAGGKLLGLLVARAAQAATDRVGGLSDRLGGVAENGGTGLTAALRGDRGEDDEDDDDGGGGRTSLLGSAFSGIKDKVKDVFGGGGGGGGGSGKKLKVTVISEDLDVGLPLRTTYDLWTQFGDFPGFMKKVETVDQESDEKTNWKAQVLWSHRTWEATIVEQVPDSHIVWKSKGAKGHVDGAVTFTEIGSNLTRVMLVLEYWPKGLFERTGNLWRAQGRRARLEFQHFRRHAMTDALLRQDEIEGWRGEIRDSEVVKTHEDALDEEQREENGHPDDASADEPDQADGLADDADREDDGGPDDEYEDEADEDAAGDEDDDELADEVDDDYDDDEYEDDTDEYDTDQDDTDQDEPDEDEPDGGRASGNGRSRRPAAAGARSRRGR